MVPIDGFHYRGCTNQACWIQQNIVLWVENKLAAFKREQIISAHNKQDTEDTQWYKLEGINHKCWETQ